MASRCVLAIAAILLIAASPAAAKRIPGNSGAHHKSVCAKANTGFARCLAEVVTEDSDASSAAPAAAAAPFGYGPADIQAAYKLPSATAGGGQTVAIVDAYDNPNAEADLAVYRSTYGLPPCTTANGCFKKVSQTGSTTALPRGDVGWGQEIALDLDAVSATCPNCKILLVEATSNSFSNLAVAENYAAAHANVVSNSFGGDEFSSETSQANSGPYAHPGVPITVSSGDDGYGVEFPAAAAGVTAVGGTTLNRAAATPRGWSESAWSGAGSGCSAYVPKPSWQHDTGCARRSVADVSAVANPSTGIAVYDTYGTNGWLVFGGTSLSAPIVAGVYALIGSPATAGPSYFYANLGNVFDVTSGSNGTCGSYLCQAVAGYDGPTGLGTPNLAGTTTPPASAPAAVTGASSNVGQSGATVAGTVNPNGQATTYHFDYGTTTAYGGSTANTSAGSGTAATAVSAALSGLSAQTTYHYRLVATNATGTTNGADATFTTSAVTPPPPPPPPGPTSHVTPAGSVALLAGTATGTAASLAADDNNVLTVTSNNSPEDWYGEMPGVSNAATSLVLKLISRTNTGTCTQTLRAYNYTTARYVVIDTRTLGSTETPVTVALGGTLANYVSGTSGSGSVRLRVTCAGAGSRGNQVSDLMNVTWVG